MILSLIKVRQELKAPLLLDPVFELNKKLKRFSGVIQPGQMVAIAVGSRGIQKGAELVSALVQWVKTESGKPVIVPAMGSHGASTSDGQKHVLAELGITEKKMGCPVCSDIAAVKIGECSGVRVYTDRFALKADHLILINRIKPHTSFHGRFESGLCKMLAIGLGKRQGAQELHQFGPGRLGELIPKVAGFLLKKLPVLFGVGILENYQERIAHLEVLSGDEFLTREPRLIKRAYQLLPRLPFSELDVLVVDELGKDKSGTGMDTNVIGRLDLRTLPELKEPRIKRIVVLNLSPKSAGSAYGIGLADITTKRVVEQMDMNAMRENALASTFVERARIPLWFDSDREAIECAIKTAWSANPKNLRLCWIKSTLEIEEFWITQNLLKNSRVNLKILSRPRIPEFDQSGNFIRDWR